jgi:hypothetical protein
MPFGIESVVIPSEKSCWADLGPSENATAIWVNLAHSVLTVHRVRFVNRY